MISQVPVTHDSVAWAREQATPQPPQLNRVSSGVSQPLSGLPSQSPNPFWHAGRQPFEVHALVPWTASHRSAHVLQLVTVPSVASQPSAGSPLQSAEPSSQAVSTQVPPLHAPEACGNSVVQLVPQSPQYSSVSRRSVSQLSPSPATHSSYG